MGLIQCHFYSEALQLSTSMTVILPQQTRSQIGMQNVKRGQRHPTLYLLHGMSDDDTIWVRRTSIERYVAPLGLAVVMPQVHRSSYTDMAYGNRYWTFLSEELPEIARSFFPLSDAREDNYVAGLSMGGYGAMKWALSKPGQFAAAASLSGGLNRARVPEEPQRLRDYKLTFGEREVAGTENDLFWLLQQCDKQDGAKPKLYQCCGTEDFLYEDNILFREACRKASFDFTYEEGPGSHEWGYWDQKIQDVLAWLPLPERV
ncbi:MAG: esterase [Paenibacillus sp.]|nr:esterase [Paenibacillus sp.]